MDFIEQFSKHFSPNENHVVTLSTLNAMQKQELYCSFNSDFGITAGGGGKEKPSIGYF